MAESKITRHLIWRFFPRQYGCPVLIWESRIRNLRVDGQPPNDSAEESAWAASTPDVLDHIGRVTAGSMMSCNRTCEDWRGKRAECLHRLAGLGRSGC